MPPQARVGDSALVPADSHGCPACPHIATGPAVQGSSNVMVNGRPAVRIGDAGIHAACCGSNLWNAKTGSRSVLINGRPAHRMNDQVKHCGGMGTTVNGSPTVIVGDYHRGCYADGSTVPKQTANEEPKHQLAFQMLNEITGLPLRRELVVFIAPDGTLHRKETNDNGEIFLNDTTPGAHLITELGDSSLHFVRRTD